MSTPSRMMPRATKRAGEPDDGAAPMGPIAPTGPHSAPGSSKRKRQDDVAEIAEATTAALAEALFSTTHALKYTGRQCMEEADPRLRAISFPRARVLMLLDDCGQRCVRMGELSAALGVTARNVTTIVDGLEREGLIVRRPDPTDRRAIRLELTPKGREHIAEVHAVRREIEERFFAALDPAERADLLRLLYKIGDAAPPEARTPRGERGRA